MYFSYTKKQVKILQTIKKILPIQFEEKVCPSNIVFFLFFSFPGAYFCCGVGSKAVMVLFSIFSSLFCNKERQEKAGPFKSRSPQIFQTFEILKLLNFSHLLNLTVLTVHVKEMLKHLLIPLFVDNIYFIWTIGAL